MLNSWISHLTHVAAGFFSVWKLTRRKQIVHFHGLKYKLVLEPTVSHHKQIVKDYDVEECITK